MKTRLGVQLFLLVCVTCATFAARAEIVPIPALPQKSSAHPAKLSAIQKQEKKFAFNWNDAATMSSAKAGVAASEAFLNSLREFSHLNPQDTMALGMLYYKLGTYYIHITRESDRGINKLLMAEAFLTGKDQKAWNINQLAYAYEQKYADSGNPSDRENALQYANKVITRLNSNARNREVAFAYYVKGMVMKDGNELPLAEMYFKTALGIYESLPEAKDDQYARAKKQLALIMLDQGGRDNQSAALLEDVKKYWLSVKSGQRDKHPNEINETNRNLTK